MPKLVKDPRLSSETEEMPRADSVVDGFYGNRSPSELSTDTSDDLESLTNPTDPRDDGLLRRLREDAEKGLSIDTIIAFFKNTPLEVLKRELEQEDPHILERLSAVAAHVASASPSASKTAPEVAASFDAAAEPGAPRWPGRKSKSDPSPVDWLKAHFGRMVGDDWDGMGLTFAMLSKRDPALALAYSRWVEKNPLDALPISKQPHTRRSDGEQKVSPPSFWKPTSELTPEQQEARRAYEAAKKRKIKVSNSL